jgi:hypothetical protein
MEAITNQDEIKLTTRVVSFLTVTRCLLKDPQGSKKRNFIE